MEADIRNRHFFALDLVTLSVAVYLSFALRLDSLNLAGYWRGLAAFAALTLLLSPALFYWGGVYRRCWAYAALEDLLALGALVLLASGVVGAICFAALPLFSGAAIPRSVPIIYAPLALLLVLIPRLAARLNAQYQHELRRRRRLRGQGNGAAERALIVGAGEAGAMTVREIRKSSLAGIQAVGFIDDDPHKRGITINGVSVLGNRYDIPRLAQALAISLVVIAMPSASGRAVREIVRICERSGVRAKIIPSLYELLDGSVSVSQLREVQIEDLLHRKPVQIDTPAVRDLLRGRRVLVTGGGGSIGGELCRQVLACEPAELIVMGHGENSIFSIHNQLLAQLARRGERAAAQAGPGCAPTRISPVIADIRFPSRMRDVFEAYRPEIVFHAAAHKHVPLMEFNPAEAITNNVLGTRTILETALATGVERFVMISSDKAVNPTSVMGASKRVAELLVHEAAVRSGRHYVAVRFGNVLGSRGSVVLTFKEQIARGGPLTVTHPDMRRFFMTIPEAVQLVLQAAVLGQSGEVFTLDMGELVKIVDLAHDMIALSGLEPGRDIDITFTGLRPGEKLYEELFLPDEEYRRTKHEKIFTAINASSWTVPDLHSRVDRLILAAQHGDEAAALALLHDLIPNNQLAATPHSVAAEPPAQTMPLLSNAVGEAAQDH